MTLKSKPLPATTTQQEDEVTAGQRRVNLLWESTQSFIAILVTGALIYVSIKKIDSDAIKTAFFLIIGFYFSRTNHAAIGGVGKKPDKPKYTGR